jgi:FHA domain
MAEMSSILASTRYQTVLLALKIAFLVLLYLFIWRIVRTAASDMQLPQESFILRPAYAGAGVGQATRPGRLVVVHSEVLEQGEEYELEVSPLTIGRAGQNDVSIDGDEFASARHVRIEPRRDGVWVQDLGSTNGTHVNGVRIDGPRKLATGDVVRVGETELRYEE